MHRSLFYYHRKCSLTRDTERASLRQRATKHHHMNQGSAGSRTLSLLFRQEGKAVGRYKAGKLMKEAWLVSRQPGKHRYRVCGQTSLVCRQPAESRLQCGKT
ncbi:IS3 family transposase [Pantoea sp.]|uniref:IS3 family transposase n=1 Tax=Pantoea sp. TaxID=69393 RepID=UPI003917C8F8